LNPEYELALRETGRIGTGKKYFIKIFGCQMNENDSEILAGILESLDYQPAARIEEADLIVINTCAVRAKPEQKVAALLGKLQDLKREKKDLLIAVGGCMTQQEEVANYLQRRFHHVDLIFGTHQLHRFPALLKQAAESRKTVVDLGEEENREGLPIRRASKFKAWLPVIYGCNNFCSYCVVPFVRGRERSRPFREIMAEAEQLAREGFLEITLLGQNVNSYGHDLQEGRDFADLLNHIDRVEGLKRIRFLTSHPKDLSPRLIRAVAEGEHICEHFHLPVQSGSNRILEMMNRRYTRERYLELVQAIRESIPGVSITTDIIVGFPGETEADFLQTLDLVEQARFDAAFTFNYSPRRGTRAALLEDDVPQQEKSRRLERLMELQNRISRETNEALVGQVVEVLVEGASKANPEMSTGRTRNNKLVHFPRGGEKEGEMLSIKITQGRTWDLFGKRA
jgi:tRNA-2-methylthio-N6-dimethylallyladenosine synthase